MVPSVAEQVLDQLLDHRGLGAAAEELTTKLGLTGREVFSAVERLRQDGYAIDYAERAGFLLRGIPACDGESDLSRLLGTRTIGTPLVYRDEVGSTNDLARQLAARGASHGTIVVARRQSAGRGRRGRSWLDVEGDQVFLSLILRPALPPERASELTLLSAVAVAEALEANGVAPQLKWPNDLEVEDRKLGGILSEMSTDSDGKLESVVVGIGINVNAPAEAFPDEVRLRATSVQVATGSTGSCAAIIASICERLEEWLVLHDVMGFEAVLDSWRARSSTIDAEVRVLVDGQAISGVAEDLDSDGSLLVRDAGGKIHRIFSGEVTTLRRV